MSKLDLDAMRTAVGNGRVRARREVAALMFGCWLLNGCVAAIAPIAAAGALGGKQVLGRKDGRSAAESATPAPATARPSQVAAAPAPPVALGTKAPATTAAPSAAAVALPTHGWRAMVVYVADAVQAKTRPSDSAVLAPGATLAAPRFLPCGSKPFAVIVDAEGTILPGSDAPGTAVRTDEAVASFGDLRFGNVTVIYTTGKPPAEIPATAAALERARLGPAMQGRELLSTADGAAGTSKAALRVAAANHYCVLALVGDEPEDFTDPLGAQGGPASVGSRWGSGWFRIPAQTAP